MQTRTLGLTALSLALFAFSCGGGGSGGSTADGTYTLDGLVMDAAFDDLSSFSATVDELRLVSPGGATTANLLAGSVSVEWLGLQTSGAWLFQEEPPEGTYTAVRVVLDGASIAAKNSAGATVAVTASSTTFDAPLATPLTVGSSGYARLIVDLDLTESLDGAVASPPLTFDPVGSASATNGGAAFTIDEVKGVVTRVDTGENFLRMNAFVDDDLNVSLGIVRVDVPPTALLISENDAVFGSRSAFYAVLNNGATLLEVHGTMTSNSTISATRIEVEDQNSGLGSSSVVKIEGRVTSIVPGTSFGLRVVEVEKGASIANPVLGSLGDPSNITVSFDSSTVFVNESHQAVTSTSLAVGQKVDVKFGTFVSSPFQANWVEIDEAPEHTAFVQDALLAPASILIRLRTGEPAIAAGLVQNASTDVFVDLATTQVFLDVEGDPVFDADDLLRGLRVNVRGAIEGTPTSPTIDASRLKVRPGRCRAQVMDVSPGTSSFTAAPFGIDDPFAANFISGPLDVIFEPTCVFDDEATSEASFFALYAGLQSGEVLEVEIKGVGSGTQNQVRAYEVKARVD